MNYRESSMIVDIFTESHGLSGFIVSGVRKSKPTLSPVIFTPGYELSVVFYERDIHQLWRIKEASIEKQMTRTPFDIIRGNTALCMCEIIKKTIHPYDVNPSLYHFLSSYFQALDQVDKTKNILLHFLTHLSIHLGFGPGKIDREGRAYFDIQSGQFLREEINHPMVLDAEVSSILQHILDVALDDVQAISMDRIHRQRLTDGLIDYVRYHSHTTQEIKSYELLKKLW